MAPLTPGNPAPAPSDRPHLAPDTNPPHNQPHLASAASARRLDPTSKHGGALGGLARGGLAGLLGAVTGAVAQFLLVLVVTRALPTAQAGAFFTVTALCLMAAGILRLDAGNGLVYVIARSHPHDHLGISGYIRAALIPVAAFSLLATAALHLQSHHIAAATGVPATWVQLLATALPLMACADALVTATRGFGAMGPTVILDGLFRPLAQLALVACLAVTADTLLLPLAWALPYVPVLVLSALWLRRRVPRMPYLAGTGRDLWRYTAPRAVAGAIQAVFQRLDIVIVAVLAGPVEAAFYTAATRFKVVGQLAGQGIAQAAAPRLVRALTCGDLPAARELYQVTTLWLVALTWPIWVAYALLSPWLLKIFGAGYDRGAQVAVVLAATMMVASACGLVDAVLTAAGHTAASLANMMAAIAVTVAVDLVLVPVHGALGAALGWSAGVLTKNLLPLLRLHRTYGLRPFGRHSLSALHPHTWRSA
ncbi:oligosaccharide flippase family protein [Streptosporangium soli]|nr:polysaccharide biosynthesis C-terminal domain-containing protein [Streptosporangium sp. KLBMP 9127]